MFYPVCYGMWPVGVQCIASRAAPAKSCPAWRSCCCVPPAAAIAMKQSDGRHVGASTAGEASDDDSDGEESPMKPPDRRSTRNAPPASNHLPPPPHTHALDQAQNQFALLPVPLCAEKGGGGGASFKDTVLFALGMSTPRAGEWTLVMECRGHAHRLPQHPGSAAVNRA